MSDSFSDRVKAELIEIYSGTKAELSALIRMNGTLHIEENKISVRIQFSLGSLARRIYSIIKDKYGLKSEIIVRYNYNFKKDYSYEIVIVPQPELDDFLQKMGFLEDSHKPVFRIHKEIKKDRSRKTAYLRGAFLGGGSINDPHGEYHLEIRCEHRVHAEDLLSLLSDFDLEASMIEHKNKFVVYLKSFSLITVFLNIIGASRSQLEMENARTVKKVKNETNRRVNAETANLGRTVEAAQNQLEDIALIEKKKGLEELTDSLQEIAFLRRENPYASLRELGEMLDPPLSKSGVNHRLRRIKKIAQNLQ